MFTRDWVRWIHQSRVQGAGLVSVVVVVGPPVGGMPRNVSRVASGAVLVVVPCGVAVVVAKNVALLKVWGVFEVSVGSGMLGAEKLRSCGLLGGSVDSVGSVVFSDGSVSLVRDAESSLAELVPAELVPAELVFVGSVLVESGLV